MKQIPLVLLCLGLSAGAFGQQVADPNFDARVEHPRFVRSHPRALFDEGHHNVHTSTSTYKGFVDLLRNDGLTVDTNEKAFTTNSLAPYQFLVIAGALGAPIGDGDRAKAPAFTAREVQAVRAWVRRGGVYCCSRITSRSRAQTPHWFGPSGLNHRAMSLLTGSTRSKTIIRQISW